MEEDLILGEEKSDELDIIESQLTVINSLLDISDDMYDAWQAQKIQVFDQAMKIIILSQKKLMKELKLNA